MIVSDLGQIYDVVLDDLERVETVLNEQVSSDEPLVDDMARHVVSTRGKRLRPALVLLAGRTTTTIGSPASPEMIALACAVELIHTATLVHDDVLDEAELRRNRPSLNALWGNQAAVIMGDFLYAKAFRMLSELGLSSILAELSATAQEICEGELAEMRCRYRTDLQEQDYLYIVERKTAALTRACCELGARQGGLDTVSQQALGQYGFQFGLAFQIVDDCLDMIGSERELGKTLGTDLTEGTMTLPVIHCLQGMTEPERQAFVEAAPVDWSRCSDMIREHESIEYAFKHARRCIDEALQALQRSSGGASRDELIAMAEYILIRQY